MLITSEYGNFTARELGCRCCGTIRYHEAFLELLQHCRDQLGPLRIISGSRCLSHNEKVGGHKNSLHLIDNVKYTGVPTIAADVSMAGWEAAEKELLFNQAKRQGLSIGVKDNSMHLDFRDLAGLERKIFTYGYIPKWAAPVLNGGLACE